MLATRTGGIISVNQGLAEWARAKLHRPASRVWYVPNFVSGGEGAGEPPELPGDAAFRVVCVANFRPEKDHLNLLKSMAVVVRYVPKAHLVLIGSAGPPGLMTRIQSEIVQNRLASHVTWLGSRPDVAAILRGCAVGVLSSASEGLPLALLEYGTAGLATIATKVGQCAEVLDHGQAGILVPSGCPELLGRSLIALLRSPTHRAELGQRFRERVQRFYSSETIMKQICRIYEILLQKKLAEAPRHQPFIHDQHRRAA